MQLDGTNLTIRITSMEFGNLKHILSLKFGTAAVTLIYFLNINLLISITSFVFFWNRENLTINFFSLP